MSGERRARVAVDIGGTFVDAVEFDETTGSLRLHKASTTPDDPTDGVFRALHGVADDLTKVDAFVHGTTLGLNAVLQRSGAPVGVITNDGFRDILEIARADVPTHAMYDFQYRPAPPIVPRRHRVGVPCRVDARGDTVTELDEAAVLDAARYLVEDQGLRAIAVCFLHSYANPAHERRTAELLRTRYPGVAVSISSDISREYREYERTSTAVLDAYIRPVLDDYITRLDDRLTGSGLAGSFHVMRSGGGAMTASLARRAPLTTVLSGPAGGVAGAAHLAAELGWDKLISFDVGGTSVDACVIEDAIPSEGYEARIDSLPMQIPVFDIRTIGAGGGSIARVDEGLLKVGPTSAGAVPGPVCYGAGGTEPTLTDAALVLGYVDPAEFLAGEMSVDAEAAREVIRTRLAEPLGIEVTLAAASVFEVLLARTVGAIREITVERGLDPREFALLAFGGAGPLLAPVLAREMELRAVVVPCAPSAFSAWGMLTSDIEYDLGATVLEPLDSEGVAAVAPGFADLLAQGEEILALQGVKPDDRRLHRRLDIRYRGQEHALPVDLHDGDTVDDIMTRFSAAHRSRYGHVMPEPGQIVTLRVRAVGHVDKPALAELEAGTPAEPVGHRKAYDFATGTWSDFAVYERTSLRPGQRRRGPAIVNEGTSTTALFSDQEFTVDPYGHLFVTTSAEEEQ